MAVCSVSLEGLAAVGRQQKFYSLPKLYKQIRRFEQRPFVGLIPDEGSLLETSNLFVSLR